MEPSTTEILSAVTALCAVLTGPFVSLYVVRREFAANVLSNNRQQWINSLRERLATVLAEITQYSLAKASGRLDDNFVIERHERFHKHWAEIALFINPLEKDHAELLAGLESTLQFLYSSPSGSDPCEMRKRTDVLVRQSQSILKREWERVKMGA